MIQSIAQRISLHDQTTIPGMGFGCYKAFGEEIIQAVCWALEAGYRYIDSAPRYENEADVGKALKKAALPREELYLVSKLWPSQFPHARASLKQTLADLGVSYLDCYLLHWPGTDSALRAQTYQQLLKFREEGLTRSIGVSNFQIEHLEEIFHQFGEYPVLNQIELHPCYPQRELCAYCQDKGIRLVAWGPLYRGKLMEEECVTRLGTAYGKTPAQILLRWHLQKGHIPIPKSSKQHRIIENGSLFDFSLSPQDMRQLDALENGEHLGNDPYTYNGEIRSK